MNAFLEYFDNVMYAKATASGEQTNEQMNKRTRNESKRQPTEEANEQIAKWEK